MKPLSFNLESVNLCSLMEFIKVMFKNAAFFYYFLVMNLYTVTIKVSGELKKKMGTVKINWSEYLRKAIEQRIVLEERKEAAKKLIENLKAGKSVVPKGFINETIRGMRETR